MLNKFEGSKVSNRRVVAKTPNKTIYGKVEELDVLQLNGVTNLIEEANSGNLNKFEFIDADDKNVVITGKTLKETVIELEIV